MATPRGLGTLFLLLLASGECWLLTPPAEPGRPCAAEGPGQGGLRARDGDRGRRSGVGMSGMCSLRSPAWRLSTPSSLDLLGHSRFPFSLHCAHSWGSQGRLPHILIVATRGVGGLGELFSWPLGSGEGVGGLWKLRPGQVCTWSTRTPHPSWGPCPCLRDGPFVHSDRSQAWTTPAFYPLVSHTGLTLPLPPSVPEQMATTPDLPGQLCAFLGCWVVVLWSPQVGQGAPISVPMAPPVCCTVSEGPVSISLHLSIYGNRTLATWINLCGLPRALFSSDVGQSSVSGSKW